MSNVKRVVLTGRIPFSWADELPAEKALLLARTFLSPTIGLRLTYGEMVGMRRNQYGGQTAYYEFAVEGEEAVSLAFLKNLRETLESAGAEVDRAQYADLENPPSKAYNF